ncbi:autotransporter domain-containing protein, partial [uncultured Oxalicibacterium sp.]|uniref:autotransporter outer membrane beta-barrel domain-containing protein n=1 Tax=uncultured Oxalicibacterium sp. TaxID=1168540 RepID=UPI0025F41C09
MNLCFKSVFNRRTGTWQVTSEKTRSAGKTGSSISKVCAASALSLSVGLAYAVPSTIDNGETETVTSQQVVEGFNFYIGDYGSGKLNIEDGGSVYSPTTYIARLAGSEGTVTVSGPNATWTNALGMTIGNQGTGTVTVTNGGKVNIGADLNLGTFGIGRGTLNVIGQNSAFVSATDLYIGNFGSGTVNIEDGGAVHSRYVFMGVEISDTASLTTNNDSSATVRGPGSVWTNTGSFTIGYQRNGTLLIENGGKVSSGSVILAEESTAEGTLTVKGSGSLLSMTGALNVGKFGKGVLSIDDGGKVVAGSVRLGQDGNIGGRSTVYLDGTSTARGTLSTAYLAKPMFGIARFNWNGGILQATNNQNDFFYQFASSDMSIGNEGAYFDTNGFNVGITTAGLLNGTGGLTKLGAGELTIAGGNSYAGNTTVSAGTLTLDTYTQSANQTLGIGATSASANGYGKLNVKGVASFNDDANLTVDVATINTLAKDQKLSGIVRAVTLNATTFKVMDNSALFNFRAVTNLDTVDLVVEAVSDGVRNATSQYGYSSASGAATVLDTQIHNGATGDMGTVVTALGRLKNRDVARATAQTLPVISGNQAIQGALSTFQNLVQQRNGIIGTSGMSSGDELSNKNGWGKVFGSRADQNDRSGAAGFKADTWGLALGADADVSPGARFGVAYGYAKTSVNGNTDLSGTTQRANIDSHVVSAYG